MEESIEHVYQVGQKIADISAQAVLPDTNFKQIDLQKLKKKWIVLFTYPLDFTFVCPTEIIKFSEMYADFKKINCEVFGLSVNSNYSQLAWINTPRNEGGLGNINYPLLSDLGGEICKKFGFYQEEEGCALRGTAIISPGGVIMHLGYNHPDVGRNIEEVLRLVQAFQSVNKTGLACQAGWCAGEKGIPKSKREVCFYESIEKEQVSISIQGRSTSTTKASDDTKEGKASSCCIII